MVRVSEAKSVNELQGHRVLYRVRGSGELKEGVVTEFACEGKFVSLWGSWREAANVEVVSDFGVPPAAVFPQSPGEPAPDRKEELLGQVVAELKQFNAVVAPGLGNGTEALKVGVLSDLTEANKKLEEENASLREQVNSARREAEAAAKAAEDSRTPQPGGGEVAPVQVLPDANGQGLAEGV